MQVLLSYLCGLDTIYSLNWLNLSATQIDAAITKV